MRRATTGDRVIAAVVALACMSVLTVAAFLRPSDEGLGTHRQLGLPSCGWMVATGKPCATCGMTTSFAHAGRGDLVRAFIAQPLGALLALGAAAGFWIALHTSVTGSRLGAMVGVGLLQTRVIWWVVGAAALAWAYKLVVTT